MKLTNPTDAELNAAFAEKVAGMEIVGLARMWIRSGSNGHAPIPHFTTSADAVLPWLEKTAWDAAGGLNAEAVVRCDTRPQVHIREDKRFIAQAGTFPLAAVIALLRAHGVEVEFTP